MSVKVQYTIPGWEPSPAPAARLDPAPSLFEARLREAAEPDLPTWRQLLRTDSPAPGDLLLPPPPRPAAFDYSDALEDRRRWDGLLRRHTASPAAGPPEVRQMLAALTRMEQEEMELYARITAENGGL